MAGIKKLGIHIEINGMQKHIGNIEYHDLTDAHFQYTQEYLSAPEAAAISISLPLQEEAFSVRRTKNFFEGLLPEGFTKKSVAKWMHVDEGDYLSILAGLGQECLGAILVTSEDSIPQTAAYEKLNEEQVAALAREGASKTAELVTKSHVSLTGASGKTGLYYDAQNHDWYMPIGDAPSTHIVKQSHVRLEGIVTNEQLCLLTAAKLGITVPESFIIRADNTEENEILFATRRYDRLIRENAEILSGLKKPLRLHQEDFAQALGISSADKYEGKDDHYLKKAFRLLAAYSSDPINDQLKLWDMMIFDYLVGNTDNHIKNLSLCYSPNLKEIRLAPAYDIISTTIYESSTRDMAIAIGDELRIDQINRDSFIKEAKKIGLGPKPSVRHFDKICDKFKKALQESAEVLSAQNFTMAEDIKKRILNSGGIKNL